MEEQAVAGRPVRRRWQSDRLGLGAAAARHVVQAEGFTTFDLDRRVRPRVSGITRPDIRPRRRRLFLNEYGCSGDSAAFVGVAQSQPELLPTGSHDSGSRRSRSATMLRPVPRISPNGCTRTLPRRSQRPAPQPVPLMVPHGACVPVRTRFGRRSSHGTKPPSGLARRAEAFGVCQDLHGGCCAPRLVPTALGVIDRRGERSGDHTGVDHPYEKWLGRIVGVSFPRLAIVVLCLGSARADDCPGHRH
jgi:hypothetical protein